MRYVLLIYLLLHFGTLSAQSSYTVTVKLIGQPKDLVEKLRYPKTIKDSSEADKLSTNLISQLQTKGYFLAETQQAIFHEKTLTLFISCGQTFQWIELSAGNLPKSAQIALKLNPINFRNERFESVKLQQLFQSILGYFENNGYPFASIKLDSIKINEYGIKAALKIAPNQFITYDSIKIAGTAQLANRFLQSYLSIKTGTNYREAAILQIEKKLSELPFLQLSRATEVQFSNQKASILVYANKKNANFFDGIVGFQQHNQTGKLVVVGDLRLQLNNLFQRAEQIDLNYQGLAKGSQLLDLKANIPTIFNTNFGLEPTFQLLKQDSAYLNLSSKISINYPWAQNQLLRLFIENKRSNLIATSAYQNAQSLPSILDANTLFYGLGVSIGKIDYKPNPRKGYKLAGDFSVGTRKISKNSNIPAGLYLQIPLQSTSYRLLFEADWFIPIATQLVFTIHNQTAIINSKNPLENEAFRLGGQKILRGFNELSILANAFTYYNTEIRYLLDTNSFLSFFFNQAVLQYKTKNQTFRDAPLGFGAGICVETNVGLLSLSYALGKQRNNPLNLQRGKLHFGISAAF